MGQAIATKVKRRRPENDGTHNFGDDTTRKSYWKSGWEKGKSRTNDAK
jgi:hypothetical protein